MHKTIKEILDPEEPEMPEDVAIFLKTELGNRVHAYYMAELDFVLAEAYMEMSDMLREERKKTLVIQQEYEQKTQTLMEQLQRI